MKNMNKFLKINIINFFIIFICILFNYFKTINYGAFIIIGILYSLFLLSQKEEDLIVYQISYLLISTVFIDYIFRYTYYNVPFEIKQFTDFISVIIMVKIMCNIKKYTCILKDSIFMIIICTIIFQVIICLVYKNNILDLFNALRMYFRFIPLYILTYVYSTRIELEIVIKEYRIYYYVNIIIIIIQIIIEGNQDNINGIFGLTGTNSTAIFIMVCLTFYTVNYIQKRCGIYKYLGVLTLTLICFIFQENKAFIVLSIGFVLIMFYINKSNMFKKISNTIVLIIIAIISVNLLVIIFPNFKSMIDKDTMKTSIQGYIIGNNNSNFEMGRFETIAYFNQTELDTNEKRMFGLGMGSATPPENWYYAGDYWGKGYVYNTTESGLYKKYGGHFGYHLSSFVVLYLETGLIGILVVIFFYIISLSRSVYLLKSNNYRDNIVANIGIMICMLTLFPIVYVAGLQSRDFMMIVFVSLGYTSGIYKMKSN